MARPRTARSSASGPRASTFRSRVYALVCRVPRGKVVTYGQVAAMVGQPRAARAVGMALGALQGARADLVPWQRVIASSGRCSHRDGFSASMQREWLRREGVRFDRGGRVDLARARWAGPRARRG